MALDPNNRKQSQALSARQARVREDISARKTPCWSQHSPRNSDYILVQILFHIRLVRFPFNARNHPRTEKW